MVELNSTLEKYAAMVNQQIEKYIPRTARPATLHQPMWELLDRGGKRFRPALTFLFCKAVGGQPRTALAAAAASVDRSLPESQSSAQVFHFGSW